MKYPRSGLQDLEEGWALKYINTWNTFSYKQKLEVISFAPLVSANVCEKLIHPC